MASPRSAAREAPPEDLAPMLARTGPLPRDEEAWAFEVKWDGLRALVSVHDGAARVRTRTGREVTGGYPELAEAPEALAGRAAVLDGEVVAFDEQGRPSFQRLQPRMSSHHTGPSRALRESTPVTFMAFDLLWLDGRSLLEEPYDERRAALEELGLDEDGWHTPAAYPGEGASLLAATRQRGLEGVIAKRRDSRYRPGRRADAWLKVKNDLRQEFVVGGFTPGTGARAQTFGALQVGVHDADGALRWAGGVGTGFTDEVLERLTKRLRRLERRTSPFAGRAAPRDTVFVTPELVCEVRFSEWTGEGSIRQSAFLGLREDKPAAEVVREVPPTDDGSSGRGAHDEAGATDGASEARGGEGRATSRGVARPMSPGRGGGRKGMRSHGRGTGTTVGAGSDEDREAAEAAVAAIPEAGDAKVEVGGRTVSLTNLDKVLFPDVLWTKGETIAWYARISPVLLPHLRDRPVTLVRWPDGIGGKSFYAKRAPKGTPDWVRTTRVESDTGRETIDYPVIDDLPTLLWAANLAGIELHPFLHRAEDSGVPRSVVFDLDPGEGTTVVECCRVGLEIRDLLGDLGLEGLPKTSGSKGLQLHVPVDAEATYERTSAFAHAVAALLERRRPEGVVSRMAKSRREGRVFVDWSQNNRKKTTIGVYSLRARDRATVSTPVGWDEVEACAEGGDPETLVFTAADVLQRVAEHGDLHAGALERGGAVPELGS